jgi:hypothetical protein
MIESPEIGKASDFIVLSDDALEEASGGQSSFNADMILLREWRGPNYPLNINAWTWLKPGPWR